MKKQTINVSKTPPVSVLLPVYNAMLTLDEAVNSIHNQTFSDFELLIVDDGSTDESPDIIHRWTQTDKRIRSIHTDHQGIVHALNTGLKQVKGTYIARMDADDISLPRRLEKQWDFLEQDPATGLVSCLVKHLGNKEEQAGYVRHVNWINSLTTYKEIRINRFIESPLAHPSVMYRKKLVAQWGGYKEGTFPEDYELWLRWLEHGTRIEKVPDILLLWRDDSDRLSRTHPNYTTDAFYHIKATYLARWLAYHNFHHPGILVWGAGRISRRRAEFLVNNGIQILGYIDVDPKKIGNVIQGRPILGIQDIPPAGSCFIISYVGLRGANAKIQRKLSSLDYQQGVHYIFAA